MTRFVTAAVALMITMPALARAGEWGTDYKAALAEAQKTGKVILADFTGSDWCGWCVKLKSEVFDTDEFKAWADKNVVLLELDFPKSKPLTGEVRAQNKELQGKFGIRGFPTIVFISADGKELGRSGYKAGGPAVWTKNADTILAAAKPTIKPLDSLAKGLEQAKGDTKLLLIVDPKSDAKLEPLFADADLAKFAKARLAVVHLKGAPAGEAGTALADLAKKYGFKADAFGIVAIDPAKEKPLLTVTELPAADKLLADLKKAVPPSTYDGAWLEDSEKATHLSAELKHPQMLLFTGSDWCSWCQKLDKEILSTKEFTNYAKAHVILFKADFPKNREVPAALKAANSTLAQKYGVRGFPTLIILSPDGKQLGTLGYMEGGPEPFLKELRKLVEKPAE